MEYEYHPTFESAFESMNQPSRIDSNIVYSDPSVNYIFGYRISRLGFGPHGTHDFYIDYHHYDRFRNEYDQASCSSYHWNTPGIYGKFLGRLSDQIAFKEGSLVEITVSRYEDNGKEYSVLGIVIGTPRSAEEVWESIRDDLSKQNSDHPIESYFEAPDECGVDGEEYFILYGPYEESLRFATFCHPYEVRPPSFDVPDKARDTLTDYYNRYRNSIRIN